MMACIDYLQLASMLVWLAIVYEMELLLLECWIKLHLALLFSLSQPIFSVHLLDWLALSFHKTRFVYLHLANCQQSLGN